jgi:hypothetical protein
MNRHLWKTLVIFGLGCNSAQPNESTVIRPLSAAIVGYGHTFAHSLFKPGDPLSQISDLGFSKIVGTNGVFATDETNGWVLATPNGGAPSTQRPPYSGDADDHNSKVLAYFLSAGIPQDQIGGVNVHTMMQGGINATGERTADRLLGYYSLLTREINGILVAESTAWARFNVDNDLVEESVFWPELPATVVDQATAMSTQVADVSQLGSLQQTIEASYPGYGTATGHVVIHHADSTYHGASFVVVTYDSTPGHDGLGVYHFDKNGQRVILAHEVAVGTGTKRR